MPGQLTLRGGILDCYSPEMDRPVRIDFFGDEIESIRKFDPETQRSSSNLDTALLLPLTEIPIDNRTLEAINARLTRSSGAPSHAASSREVGSEATVFPGWEFFAPASAITSAPRTSTPAPGRSTTPSAASAEPI
jgi:transcription-repair coupling factor (superfamily II helicase)